LRFADKTKSVRLNLAGSSIDAHEFFQLLKSGPRLRRPLSCAGAIGNRLFMDDDSEQLARFEGWEKKPSAYTSKPSGSPSQTGFEETEVGIASKLARGTFSATFSLACLAALELEGVRLEDI
jgi:hypothetical protein